MSARVFIKFPAVFVMQMGIDTGTFTNRKPASIAAGIMQLATPPKSCTVRRMRRDRRSSWGVFSSGIVLLCTAARDSRAAASRRAGRTPHTSSSTIPLQT